MTLDKELAERFEELGPRLDLTYSFLNSGLVHVYIEGEETGNYMLHSNIQIIDLLSS